MMRKVKPKKHTTKRIVANVAMTNHESRKTGKVDHMGQDKGGHTNLEFPLCKTTTLDIIVHVDLPLCPPTHTPL
ncbi:hypothetical protein COCNU_scaffold001489G000020 [Cocos nucifera]|nr:hypothetical protein [Cocos nucifera]